MLLDDPNFGDIKNDDVLLHNDITLLNPAIRDLADTKKFLLDSNNKDIFTNISSGVSEENIIDNNSYLFTNKLSKLLEKFPKIQEIIGNNYLYTDINEDDSLKMLDDVLADRLLMKKRK